MDDAPVTGQSDEGSLEVGQEQSGSEPYFQFSQPDGNVESFATKDDLERAWKDSYLRHSDYTRKTQSLSEERKKFDKDFEDYKDEQRAFRKTKEQYDEWDKLIKTRPDIYKQLSNMSKTAPNASTMYERATGYADEKTSAVEKRLESLEEQLMQANSKKEIDSIFSKMEGQFKDFDRDKIREYLEHLSTGETEPLVEMAYWATKGRTDPLAMEQKIAENFQKKKSSGLMPSGGVPSKGTGYNSLEEGKEAALKDAGLI